MTSADDLAHSLTTFFRDHLPLRRGASRHTILAYRDALKLFLRFAAARTGRSVPDLRVTDLDVETALAFLDALETARHNAIATRNIGAPPSRRSFVISGRSLRTTSTTVDGS